MSATPPPKEVWLCLCSGHITWLDSDNLDVCPKRARYVLASPAPGTTKPTQCEERFTDLRCVLPAGHKGKHSADAPKPRKTRSKKR